VVELEVEPRRRVGVAARQHRLVRPDRRLRERPAHQRRAQRAVRAEPPRRAHGAVEAVEVAAADAAPGREAEPPRRRRARPRGGVLVSLRHPLARRDALAAARAAARRAAAVGRHRGAAGLPRPQARLAAVGPLVLGRRVHGAALVGAEHGLRPRPEVVPLLRLRVVPALAPPRQPTRRVAGDGKADRRAVGGLGGGEVERCGRRLALRLVARVEGRVAAHGHVVRAKHLLVALVEEAAEDRSRPKVRHLPAQQRLVAPVGDRAVVAARRGAALALRRHPVHREHRQQLGAEDVAAVRARAVHARVGALVARDGVGGHLWVAHDAARISMEPGPGISRAWGSSEACGWACERHRCGLKVHVPGSAMGSAMWCGLVCTPGGHERVGAVGARGELGVLAQHRPRRRHARDRLPPCRLLAPRQRAVRAQVAQ